MRNLPEMSSGEDKSGTTAVCAFVSPKGLFIANCGDSRAMLCRNGVPVFSTQDHKPGLPSERDRIVSAGGRVMIQRVNGTLVFSCVFFRFIKIILQAVWLSVVLWAITSIKKWKGEVRANSWYHRNRKFSSRNETTKLTSF